MRITTRVRAFLLGHEFGRENPGSTIEEAVEANPYPPGRGLRQRRSRWFDGYAEATEAVAREAAEAA
jgi:hypothetical protein